MSCKCSGGPFEVLNKGHDMVYVLEGGLWLLGGNRMKEDMENCQVFSIIQARDDGGFS